MIVRVLTIDRFNTDINKIFRESLRKRIESEGINYDKLIEGAIKGQKIIDYFNNTKKPKINEIKI